MSSDIKTYSCKSCDLNFRSPKLLREHKAEHLGSFKCDPCGKFYLSKSTLQTHKRNNHGSFSCSKCNFTYTKLQGLTNHIKSVHKKIKPYKCTFCQRGHPFRSALYKHMRIHVGEQDLIKCKEPGCDHISGSTTSARTHRQKMHPKPSDPKDYPCPHCDKICLSFTGRTYHINTIHKGKKTPFKCSLCDKSYSSGTNLEYHTAVVHTGERAFKCKEKGCNKEFPTKGKFTAHMKTHLKQQIRCEQCSKCFTRRDSMLSHVRRIHPEDPSIFTCYFCGERRGQVTNLVNHMGSFHTMERGYKCNLCPKGFSGPRSLHWHLDSEHNKRGKNTKCYFCSITIHSDYYFAHLVKHTKEMQFYCTICGKEDHIQYNIKTHVRKIHGLKYEGKENDFVKTFSATNIRGWK